ncbi:MULTISPECIES: GntR family transcriptional regulator [unclassified Novosphingobium]|uniref:GntR family transcriptional regulator n=1 Tax=unclassified Novosphingobium TaxID=2644732 RepID=UPI00146B411B|nr:MULTISPECIES: GntR family transcriptional regulator [unclassified Novosphingobium]NMN04812.1 DNA-binding GntR family transcriptional regulator [Novosphingobium sp. SG919]NMN85194.1 DNA-binding GntR family transcriptional regulator [Novosphingobium sp. SG916]
MSPAHVFEPTYRTLRERLLTATWPAGTRLESARLAAMLMVSATPVRDSLNRLLGEGLVMLHPGLGFLVPRLLEQDVRDLLACQHRLLLIALESASFARQSDAATHRDDAAEEHSATRRRALIASIALACNNRAWADLAHQIEDRLAPVLHREADVLDDVAAELDSLENTWSRARSGATPATTMVPLLDAYVQRRSGAASALLVRLAG